MDTAEAARGRRRKLSRTSRGGKDALLLAQAATDQFRPAEDDYVRALKQLSSASGMTPEQVRRMISTVRFGPAVRHARFGGM